MPGARRGAVNRQQPGARWKSLTHQKYAQWPTIGAEMRLSVVWRKEPVQTGQHVYAVAVHRMQSQRSRLKKRLRFSADLRLITDSSFHLKQSRILVVPAIVELTVITERLRSKTIQKDSRGLVVLRLDFALPSEGPRHSVFMMPSEANRTKERDCRGRALHVGFRV